MSKLYDNFRVLVAPVLNPFLEKRMLKKWEHHAIPGELPWDWLATKYNRIAVVNMICGAKNNPDYLEIGCFNDALFSSVFVDNKVGVDPERGGTYRGTSDDFFAANSETFDVIFIDGLHTYEQVRKDVQNALQCLNANGWIALHDMLPRNWKEEHVPRISGLWSGDVWKVAFEIDASDDLEFIVLSIDHGVGVIKPKKVGAKLAEKYDELREKDFAFYYDNVKNLPILDWTAGRAWIQSHL